MDSVNTKAAVCLIGDTVQMTISTITKAATWKTRVKFWIRGSALFPKTLTSVARRTIAQYIIVPCHLSDL